MNNIKGACIYLQWCVLRRRFLSSRDDMFINVMVPKFQNIFMWHKCVSKLRGLHHRSPKITLLPNESFCTQDAIYFFKNFNL